MCKHLRRKKKIFFRRRPAWTDRVLYKAPKHCFSNVTLSAEQTSYRSHPGYNISDHKPVTSEFTIKVSTYEKDLENIFEKLLKLGV